MRKPSNLSNTYLYLIFVYSPDDTNLVREVGKALIMTHDFKRAVKYYETCLQDDPKLLDLRTDLADLYIKLRAFEDAKRVLIEALKFLKDQKPDIDTKAKNVQYLIMMSKVFLEEDTLTPDWRFKENTDAK
jgi:tetratricopeptide repeat protein 21B